MNKSSAENTNTEGGIKIFFWTCPNCEKRVGSQPPETGDRLECIHCDFNDEVSVIETADPVTPLGHLAGRLGFPDHAYNWTYSDWFAYLFNTIALGLGVLLGLYHTYNQNWKSVLIIFGILLPAYFWLQKKVDAPRHN